MDAVGADLGETMGNIIDKVQVDGGNPAGRGSRAWGYEFLS